MSADVERIAAVLAEHSDWHTSPGNLEIVMCLGCSWYRSVPMDGDNADMRYREHQVEQLAAAGIGDTVQTLRDAASDLRGMHEPIRAMDEEMADWLDARAERIRNPAMTCRPLPSIDPDDHSWKDH